MAIALATLAGVVAAGTAAAAAPTRGDRPAAFAGRAIRSESIQASVTSKPAVATVAQASRESSHAEVTSPQSVVGSSLTSLGKAVHTYGDVSDPQGIVTGSDGNLWFTNQGTNSIGRITPTGAVFDYTAASIDISSGPSGVEYINPGGITRGPDNALWFTNYATNSIGRITTAGVVTNYTDSTIDGPEGITTGPDGALWFTNIGNNSIGRITTAGVVTNYTDSTIAGPGGITSGPGNALWFTNYFGDSIGRITTAGVVTSFTGVNSYSTGITVGPDGNLWYTNPVSDLVGKMTPTGTVTTYSTVLSAVDHPTGIVSGPDGNLWVTNDGGGYPIGQITTSGSITGFPDSQVLCDPVGITVGPDGALWFTNTTGAIGRITTAGVLTNYVGMTASSGIAAGTDGALWFTNYGGNYLGSGSIGRISTGGVVTHYLDPGIVDPSSITAGPGGMWFVAGFDSIGRITTAGVVTVYTTPAILDPGTITSGPDGNLWFTDGSSIGRITPSGVVTNYTSSSITSLGGIVAGSDGALWFTNGESIGRVTITGQFSFYKATPLDATGEIARGTDGALWFVNYGSIGRITTAGKFTFYSDTYLDTDILASQISAEPNGSLWFSVFGVLGHISASGTVTNFDATALEVVRGIAVGPGGAVWMSDNSHIVRLSTVSPIFTAGPALIGPSRVGKVDTCSFRSANADSASVRWLVNGVAQRGATGIHFTPTGADLAKQLWCSVTLSGTGGSLTRSSSRARVRFGVALVVVHVPKLSGSHDVNKAESVSSGLWSPGASSYSYQWYLGRTKIPGATSPRFIPPSRDRSMRLHCVVAAHRLGYANGTYTTPSVTIT